MRIDHQSPFGAWLLRFGAWLLRWIVQLLGVTCRLEVVAGQEHLDALLTTPDSGTAGVPGCGPGGPPVVLSFWHSRSILALYLVYHRLIRRGLDVTTLISQSRDGELVSHLARHWKLSQIRGSATRGGRAALRALYKATRAGSSPVMIPDGPHGPAQRFKVGTVVLAQMARVPILPLGFAASRCWRIRSWDRLIVPKPFARIAVVVGTPERVARDLDSEALENTRLRLEQRLDDLTLHAARAVA